MDRHILLLCRLLLLSSLICLSVSQDVIRPKPLRPNSQISVIGTVYCDVCSNNTFSTHSYFLPGVEVKIECKLKARGEKTLEEITLSAKRRTNRFGWYRVEIPSADGIECAEESTVVSHCTATVLAPGSSSSWSSCSKCNVPGLTTTSQLVYFNSRKANVCVYSLTALNFRPSTKNTALCGR